MRSLTLAALAVLAGAVPALASPCGTEAAPGLSSRRSIVAICSPQGLARAGTAPASTAT
jgi:hypothetical protein